MLPRALMLVRWLCWRLAGGCAGCCAQRRHGMCTPPSPAHALTMPPLPLARPLCRTLRAAACMGWRSFGRSTTTQASRGTSQTWRCCQRCGLVGGWLCWQTGAVGIRLACAASLCTLRINHLHPATTPCPILHPGWHPSMACAIPTLAAPLLLPLLPLLRVGPLMLHTMLIPRPLHRGGRCGKAFFSPRSVLRSPRTRTCTCTSSNQWQPAHTCSHPSTCTVSACCTPAEPPCCA